MTVSVLATGTFDLLHPGHVHYLEESANLGDELSVIVSRAARIEHKVPILPDRQRRAMVEALEPVDCALIGSENSMFEPVREVDPDIVTLGYDQHHSTEKMERKLANNGFEVDVVRLGEFSADAEFATSSTEIRKRILDRRAAGPAGQPSVPLGVPSTDRRTGSERSGPDIRMPLFR